MRLTIQAHDAYCYTGGKKFDASLPTAVFIHGAQNDHSVWALQTRYFAHHGFNVLAVDLPGHGRSKGPALTTVESMADWLLALLDATSVPHAILIGHSMGSLIALETAFRAPAHVTGIALVATAYPMKVSQALLDAALNDEQKAFDMVNIWSHSSVAQKPSFPGPGFYAMGGALRLKQRISKINPDHVFHTDFRACDAYANGEQAASSIKCPAMLLLGEGDLMTSPKATGILSNGIRNCKVLKVKGAGHELMAEQPDAVLDALFSFAKSAQSKPFGNS